MDNKARAEQYRRNAKNLTLLTIGYGFVALAGIWTINYILDQYDKNEVASAARFTEQDKKIIREICNDERPTPSTREECYQYKLKNGSPSNRDAQKYLYLAFSVPALGFGLGALRCHRRAETLDPSVK